MEAVLGHLEHIVELLAVSQTDCVNEWDRQTLLRALQWARYCERIHARFSLNPAVRSELESRLRDTNQRLQETLASFSPVTLSDLAQCQHKLLVNLLSNPSAPPSVIRVFSPHPKTSQELELDQTCLITCKSALTVLCCSLDRSFNAGLQPEAEVRGKLLSKRLNAILTRSGNRAFATQLLDSVLLDSAGKTESLYDVIAAALLADDGETNDVTSDVILDWLKGRDGCLGKLCKSSSTEICSVLARRSVTFKEGYWDVLKGWASCLEYDVMQGAWMPTSEEPVTFDDMLDRLSALIRSRLKGETETKLAALKLESGDFDVKGVSVWTDLIFQLKV